MDSLCLFRVDRWLAALYESWIAVWRVAQRRPALKYEPIVCLTHLDLGHVFHFDYELFLTSVRYEYVLFVADVERWTLAHLIDRVSARLEGRLNQAGRKRGPQTAAYSRQRQRRSLARAIANGYHWCTCGGARASAWAQLMQLGARAIGEALGRKWATFIALGRVEEANVFVDAPIAAPIGGETILATVIGLAVNIGPGLVSRVSLVVAARGGASCGSAVCRKYLVELTLCEADTRRR